MPMKWFQLRILVQIRFEDTIQNLESRTLDALRA